MRNVTLLLLVLLLLVLPACQGEKDKSKPKGEESAVGTLTVIAETATIMVVGESTPREVQTGQSSEIREGDQVVTSLDGEAVLTFYTGAETHLMPGTSIVVEQFDRSGASSQIKVNVVVGQTVTNIETALDANSSHEVDTPVATIVVRGTDFAIFARPNNLTQVATLDGTVSVTAQDQQTAEIPCGYGVMIAPEGTLGEVKVWGLTQIELTALASEVPPLPVTFEKMDNGLLFHYRTGDLMAVPLGSYTLTVQGTVPIRVENVEYPATLSAETITTIPVALSGITITAPEGTGNLSVHLQQGDIVGDVITAPGVPMIVSPGAWTLTVAPENQPDQTQTFDITVAEAETLDIPLGD